MSESSNSEVCEKTVSPMEINSDEKVDVMHEEEFGRRNPRLLPDPKLPSKQEVDKHNITHLPYRSWCPHCIMGKGKAASHFRLPEREDGIPEVHVDYCFMWTKGSAMATILVAKEKATKSTLSTVVPMTGASVEFPVRRIISFLKELGLEQSAVVLKPDQEPAITDVLNAVAARRTALSKLEETSVERPVVGDGAIPVVGPVGRSMPESSPVGSSGSNGFIERAAQSVEGQVRVIKSAFETRTGMVLPSEHAMVPWLVEYASSLLNRGQVGKDGKTPYERLKGKSALLPGVEFGEKLFWRTNTLAYRRKDKMDS